MFVCVLFGVKSLILLEGAGFITQRAGVQISPLLPVVARDLGFEAFWESGDVCVFVCVLSISIKHFIENSRRFLCLFWTQMGVSFQGFERFMSTVCLHCPLIHTILCKV